MRVESCGLNMNDPKSSICTVCGSSKHSAFISTLAMMHTQNNEQNNFQKCANCHSIFLSNQVAEENLSTYYSENYLPYRGANAWGKFKDFVENDQKKLDSRRVKMVKRALRNMESNFRLLDVGCGKPSFLKQVQAKLNAKCTGIDFSDHGWKGNSYNGLTLIKTSLENFEPEEKFDIITLWHYLEHDYHLKETAQKLYRCLKPGGRLIIEVPDYKSITAKNQKEYWQGWHSPRHITLFSKKGFQTLFDAKKWNIIRHFRYGTLDAFTLWWLGRMEEKQVDWSSSMENEFWPLVFLKVLSAPLFVFEKLLPLGIQLVIIEKRTQMT